MTFPKISAVETVELLELRLEEVERQCLSFCRIVISDEDCNAAAAEAKRWFAAWKRNEPSTRAVNALAAVATWFSNGLRFSLSKAISGPLPPLSQASDLPALLYASIRPVALEHVYRNPEAGLEKLQGEYLRQTGLNANATGRSVVPSIDNAVPPEGISDEELAREQDDAGVLGGAPFLMVPDAGPRLVDHDLVEAPRRYYSIQQRLEDLLAELERTGRLLSIKHRGDLMRCRKIVRRLAEAAFVPEQDQDGTTARVYRACLTALQDAAGSSTPQLEPRLLENAAAAFTGRLMELANLTEPKTEPSTQTRRERVSAAVRRVDERTRSPSHANPPETPPGE